PQQRKKEAADPGRPRSLPRTRPYPQRFSRMASASKRNLFRNKKLARSVRRAATRQTRLDIESLEERALMAVSITTVATPYTQTSDGTPVGSLPTARLANKPPTGPSPAPFTGTPGAAVTPTAYPGSTAGGFYYFGTPDQALGTTGSNSFGGAVYGVNFTNDT